MHLDIFQSFQKHQLFTSFLSNRKAEYFWQMNQPWMISGVVLGTHGTQDVQAPAFKPIFTDMYRSFLCCLLNSLLRLLTIIEILLSKTSPFFVTLLKKKRLFQNFLIGMGYKKPIQNSGSKIKQRYLKSWFKDFVYFHRCHLFKIGLQRKG